MYYTLRGYKVSRGTMRKFVQTEHGRAYFDMNPQHGDKLEISTKLNGLRERLFSLINSWNRAAEYDDIHRKLFTTSLQELQDIVVFSTELQKILQNYVDEKQVSWEAQDEVSEHGDK